MREQAVLFGEKKSLVGILTDPPDAHMDDWNVGAILLNSGIVHRVGPGRVYVKIARQLAALGLTTFRFDFSGIGDSKPRPDNLPFDKSSVDETQRAMAVLEKERGIRRFILIGVCSGARVSLATACLAPGILGSILINYPVESDDDSDLNLDLHKRNDEHYYLNLAIRNWQSWRKFLTGKANYRRILEAFAFRLRHRFGPQRKAPREWLVFRQDLETAVRRGVRPVFICSQGDPSLEELREAGGRTLAEFCSRRKAELIIIPRSDHTFSSLFDQQRLLEVVGEKAIEIAGQNIEATLTIPHIVAPPEKIDLREYEKSLRTR
jgi:pimeloyl-ACP methyl ester carboxylesterase